MKQKHVKAKKANRNFDKRISIPYNWVKMYELSQSINAFKRKSFADKRLADLKSKAKTLEKE